MTDEEAKEDPLAYERRLLLDTWRTFGCDDGKATFSYGLLDAVRHKPTPYLVNPVAIDARTDITTQMLAKGFKVTVTASEDGQETELVFAGRDFERKFFSDETNRSFTGCFFDHAKCDPLTGEIGKTICFAVSRKHATKLVTLLNAEATRRWPEVYGAGSDFAVQVTSDQPGAQQMTIDFANNNLNGKSRWHAAEFRDYDTSRTRVCVTVGMMTTGYDCEDLLNVVLARPIFSPTDFVQIKGRGTRLFTFKHHDSATERTAAKDGFVLFDFFANCEFFEKTFNYDRKITLPKGQPGPGPETGTGGTGGTGPAKPATYTNTSADPLAAIAHEPIGDDGMRIDREMYRARFTTQAQELAAQHPALSEAVAAENWPEAEAIAAQLLLEKPKEFWNLLKLQQVFRSDRNPSLREILRVIFGFQPEVVKREQLAAECFAKYLAATATDATKTRELRHVFNALVLDGPVCGLIERGEFAQIRSMDAGLYQAIKTVGAEELKALAAYVAANVAKDDFVRVA